MHHNKLAALGVFTLTLVLAGCGAGLGGPASRRGAVETGRSVSVLAYNIFLRPHLVGLADKKKERLSTIQAAAASHDIVGFSEAFDDGLRAQIRSYVTKTHPYAVEPPVDPNGIREDGGVFLLSRYPVEFAKTLVYRNAKGADGFSAKGAIYARVHFGPGTIDFILTHLQSGAQHADVRERQLEELVRFAAQFEDPAIAQIVLGDLNVVEDVASEYAAMLRILGSPLDIYRYLNQDSGFTWDGLKNPLADNQSQERIDYLLCRRCGGHEGWLAASRVEPFPMKVPAGKAKFGSDHFGVSAVLTLP